MLHAIGSGIPAYLIVQRPSAGFERYDVPLASAAMPKMPQGNFTCSFAQSNFLAQLQHFKSSLKYPL
jgi:hypothetical protein